MLNKPVTINGHDLTLTGENIHMGSIGLMWEWQCSGCGERTDAGNFSVGARCKGAK